MKTYEINERQLRYILHTLSDAIEVTYGVDLSGEEPDDYTKAPAYACGFASSALRNIHHDLSQLLIND